MSELVRLPDPRDKPWLTVAELAEITGEGEKVIRAALEAGQLPLLQVGRYKRISTAAFRKLCGLPETDEPAAALAVPDAELASVHAITAARAP